MTAAQSRSLATHAPQYDPADRPVVVFAIDEGYAMPLAVVLRSIIEASTDGDFDFRILHNGISEHTRIRVENSLPTCSATIRWLHIDIGDFSEFGTLPHVSKMTYARLLIEKLILDSKRVIYLDTDTLVLTDLHRLWSEPLGGAPAGAVVDGMNLALQRDEHAHPGLPRVRSYLNAGVLVIDLDLWRGLNVSQTAIDYLLRNPESPYSDQDALNFSLDGRWKELDPKWNCQAHLDYYGIDIKNIDNSVWILHFVTAGKPWNFWVPNANAQIYDRVRNKTAFARTVRERSKDTLRRLCCHIKNKLQDYRGGIIVYMALKKIVNFKT